jgi:hypothetical protein
MTPDCWGDQSYREAVVGVQWGAVQLKGQQGVGVAGVGRVQQGAGVAAALERLGPNGRVGRGANLVEQVT